MSALFAALICVATMFIMVPLPGNGYANFGDCFILVGALMLGPVYGAAAAGIGAALSDLFLGYAVYAPATFVIKALMAVVVYGVCHTLKKKGVSDVLSVLPAVIAAELLMIAGYFLFEIPLYGIDVALVDIIGNGVQGLVGAVSGFLVYNALHKIGVAKKTLAL